MQIRVPFCILKTTVGGDPEAWVKQGQCTLLARVPQTQPGILTLQQQMQWNHINKRKQEGRALKGGN